MSRNRSSLFFLTFLVLLAALGFSPAAKADYSADNTAIGNCKTTAQNNSMKAAQDKSAVVNNVFTGVPTIDARLYSCVQGIRAVFNENAIVSNPMSILANFFQQEIVSMINQLCSNILADVQSVMKSAFSLLNVACVPLPQLNLGKLNLNLPTMPCNGVNLLQPQITSGSAPSTAASWSIWSK